MHPPEGKSGQSRRSRARGALLGAALGDALGAPLEGTAGGELAAPPPGRPLRYTDDTHMTLATARSLLACGGLDPAHLARTFAAHHEAEPWRGYGPGPPRIFALLRRGVPWEEAALRVYAGGSFGNGGAMRAAPIGVAFGPSLERVAHAARESARITHAHPLGMEGAALQAAAVAWLAHAPAEPEARADPGRRPARELLPALAAQLRTAAFRGALREVDALPRDLAPGEVARRLGHGIEALRSVPTALYAFLRHPDDFEAVIRLALRIGGDTDTIACMAGALAGAWLGEEGLPADWREAVEDAQELASLADGLARLAQTGPAG